MAKRKRGREKRQKRSDGKQKAKVGRYYPTMFCMAEGLYIGVSKLPMKFRSDRFGNIKPKYKVTAMHWTPMNCSFRANEYIIDMREKNEGDLILCNKCGGKIDFRLFYSCTVPRMIEL